MLVSQRTRDSTTSTSVSPEWTETKFVGDFTDWDTFGTKFPDRFGIELTPDARGTQAETLYIRDGELCHNFIDRCRLYQYEVSQQTKQTIARALPACNKCDTCHDCPTREEKIKRITDAVSQREGIDLVIHGLQDNMREEVKKLSEGKSFKEICKIIYRLENSSTKPTKDPHSQRRQPATARVIRSAPSATAEEAEKKEVNAAEGEEEATSARCATPGAANRQTGQFGSSSTTFPWTSAPSAQRRGTWPTTAESLQTGTNGTSS